MKKAINWNTMSIMGVMSTSANTASDLLIRISSSSLQQS
jgi:hypothetical protein